jgi:hypothetical protein
MNWPLIAAAGVAAVAFFVTGGMPWTSRLLGVVVAAGVAFGGVHLWIKHDLANAGVRAEEQARIKAARERQQNEKLGFKREE